jgi:hypothetical protein
MSEDLLDKREVRQRSLLDYAHYLHNNIEQLCVVLERIELHHECFDRTCKSVRGLEVQNPQRRQCK